MPLTFHFSPFSFPLSPFPSTRPLSPLEPHWNLIGTSLEPHRRNTEGTPKEERSVIEPFASELRSNYGGITENKRILSRTKKDALLREHLFYCYVQRLLEQVAYTKGDTAVQTICVKSTTISITYNTNVWTPINRELQWEPKII